MPDSPRFYFDASVYLAFLNSEPDRADAVASLLDDAQHGSIEVITSTVSLAEVVYLRSRASDLSPEETDERIDGLLRNEAVTTLVQLSSEIGVLARRFARVPQPRQSHLRVRDAIHLATAVVANVEFFCSYDSDFVPFQSQVDFEITEPFVRSPNRPIPGL